MTYLMAANVIATSVCALCLLALAPAVLRDTQRAPEYRSDALKLLAGVFARSGRNPVLARRNREQAGQAEKGQDDDLSHDLIVAARSDR